MIYFTPSGPKHIPLVALVAFSMLSSVSAESADAVRCNDLPSYHLLDFWVGDWDVYVDDKKVGHNRIEKTLNGCAVIEHWVDSAGNEGQNLFFVNDGGTW